MRSKIFSILFCLTLLVVPLLLAAPVQAAPAMAPMQGIVGTYVTVSGLTSGASYILKWDSTTLASGTVPMSGSIAFYAPDAPRGPHTVVVENPAATVVLTTSFTIVASMDISPTSGPSETIITAVGRGFGAWESNIRVTYDTVLVTPAIFADGNGSWLVQFLAPSSARGYHLISAFGSLTPYSEVFDRTFIILPRIRIGPASGCVGTSVTVTGTGFSSIEPNIRITFDDQTVRSGIQSRPDGSWSNTFTVPSAGRGNHIVAASGDSTYSSGVPYTVFTVMASAFIDPTVGTVGDTIRVFGKGFESNEPGITISYDGQVVRSGIVADIEGNWTSSLEIPATISGPHEIGASGSSTTSLNCAGTTLTVQAKVTINPAGGNVGDTITLTGSGFGSQRSVTITYGGEPVFSGTTDARGSFAASFKAPRGKSGAINVVASDASGVTATAVFAMETTPPPVPQLLSPPNARRVGFAGSSRVDFDWGDVSDPSGVYYTLEISSQPNFPSMLIRVVDLINSEYSLSETEALPYGEYYWRVRAIDGAGNASAWTSPFLVKVAYMTMETFILIVVVVVIVIILAVALPLALRRKGPKTS